MAHETRRPRTTPNHPEQQHHPTRPAPPHQNRTKPMPFGLQTKSLIVGGVLAVVVVPRVVGMFNKRK